MNKNKVVFFGSLMIMLVVSLLSTVVTRGFRPDTLVMGTGVGALIVMLIVLWSRG